MLGFFFHLIIRTISFNVEIQRYSEKKLLNLTNDLFGFSLLSYFGSFFLLLLLVKDRKEFKSPNNSSDQKR